MRQTTGSSLGWQFSSRRRRGYRLLRCLLQTDLQYRSGPDERTHPRAPAQGV